MSAKSLKKSQEFQNFVQVPLFLKTKLTMAALLLEVKMEKHGVQPMLTQEQANISLMATFLVNALTRIVFISAELGKKEQDKLLALQQGELKSS